jgi:multimeric flavodoxin WrbA
MHIVALCGSPRPRGNTATLIDAILEGAAGAGATTTRFDLAKLDVRGCRACDACLETAEAQCVQQDDMSRILEALRTADAWVLGTPVYYAHLSGYLKTAIDRMYSLWTTEGGWQLGLPGTRRGAVVVVQADPEKETPAKVADYVASVIEWHNGQVVGRIAESGLGAPGDAAARPDLLAKAKDIGRKLVG